MIIFEKGIDGAGNKLRIDIDDIVNKGIDLLDFQKLLCRTNVPRMDLGQEKRVWIIYSGKPIVEIGVEEIKAVLNLPLRYLNRFQEDTVIAIKSFIHQHQEEVDKLLQNE